MSLSRDSERIRLSWTVRPQEGVKVGYSFSLIFLNIWGTNQVKDLKNFTANAPRCYANTEFSDFLLWSWIVDLKTWMIRHHSSCFDIWNLKKLILWSNLLFKSEVLSLKLDTWVERDNLKTLEFDGIYFLDQKIDFIIWPNSRIIDLKTWLTRHFLCFDI